MHFRAEVASACGRPKEGMQWICKVDEVSNVDELEDDGPLFEHFSSKVAAGLLRILQGEFRRKVMILQEARQLEAKVLNGRQIAFLFFQEYRRPEEDARIYDLRDLMAVKLTGDNLPGFVNAWNLCLMGMQNVPDDPVLETLFYTQVMECTHFKPVMQMYLMKVTHEGAPRSYQQLLSLVCTHIESRRRDKVRDQWNTPPKQQPQWQSGGGHSNPSGGGAGDNPATRYPGECYKWLKEGKCAYGDRCSYNHVAEHKGIMKPAKGKGGGKGKGKDKGKPKKQKDGSNPSTPRSQNSGKGKAGGRGKGKGKGGGRKGKGGTPGSSTPGTPRNVPASRNEMRGTAPNGELNRPYCHDHAKGNCTRGGECNFYHIPRCRFFLQGRCEMGNKCVFLHPQRDGRAQVNQDSTPPPPQPHPAGRPGGKTKAKATGKAKAKAKGKAKNSCAGPDAEDEQPLNE